MNLFRREESVSETQLNSASQQKIASLVKALGDDDLSMSWRSDLNAKLAAAQQAKAKKTTSRRFYAWGSTLSLGVAATCFAVVMMTNTPAPQKPIRTADNSFASELVKAHQETLVMSSVSGTGAAARETSYLDDSSGNQDDLL